MKKKDLGQWRYNHYLNSIINYGVRHIGNAYKKPSAAKQYAWEILFDYWYNRADKDTMTVVQAGCQSFTVGLIMHKDIFVYITKSNRFVYKIDPISNTVLYEIPYDNFHC